MENKTDNSGDHTVIYPQAEDYWYVDGSEPDGLAIFNPLPEDTGRLHQRMQELEVENRKLKKALAQKLT